MTQSHYPDQAPQNYNPYGDQSPEDRYPSHSGTIGVPEQSVGEHDATTPTQEKQSNWKKKLALALAGATLLGGGVAAGVLAKSGGNEKNGAPEPVPSSSAPQFPGQTIETSPTAPSMEMAVAEIKEQVEKGMMITFDQAGNVVMQSEDELAKSLTPNKDLSEEEAAKVYLETTLPGILHIGADQRARDMLKQLELTPATYAKQHVVGTLSKLGVSGGVNDIMVNGHTQVIDTPLADWLIGKNKEIVSASKTNVRDEKIALSEGAGFSKLSESTQGSTSSTTYTGELTETYSSSAKTVATPYGVKVTVERSDSTGWTGAKIDMIKHIN